MAQQKWVVETPNQTLRLIGGNAASLTFPLGKAYAACNSSNSVPVGNKSLVLDQPLRKAL